MNNLLSGVSLDGFSALRIGKVFDLLSVVAATELNSDWLACARPYFELKICRFVVKYFSNFPGKLVARKFLWYCEKFVTRVYR